MDSTRADGGANTGSKLLSAREHLLPGAGGSAAALGQSSESIIAIQQATEWLPTTSPSYILPASRLQPFDEDKRNGEVDSSNEVNIGSRSGYGRKTVPLQQLKIVFCGFGFQKYA
jgi:hypothetical protein